ncbi:MAG: chemotaxis protein CheB [Desulfobacteraceae bacterium IS3]|nr:MAG: chemotaxis protein CheB [Desulfobacteraceae bacterium IS3]
MKNRKSGKRKYKAVVMGSSAGGLAVLARILSVFPQNFRLPLIVVQHLHPRQGEFYIQYLNDRTALTVKEADEKEDIVGGYVYFAPPNYHLLIEEDETFSLSSDEKVNYSRPSIDVLFESAAEVYGNRLAGVILTGANNDGASGLNLIKKNGGLAVVQEPCSAESPYMPRAALELVEADYILSPEEIGTVLVNLGDEN